MPGSHNLIVYSDIRILRRVYSVYIESLLENNEIVLILTHYDSPAMMRQMLLNADNKENNTLDLEGYMHNGSLLIVDSLMSYFNSGHNDGTDKNNNLNFLSLIKTFLDHGIKKNRNGITIFSDMAHFFTYILFLTRIIITTLVLVLSIEFLNMKGRFNLDINIWNQSYSVCTIRRITNCTLHPHVKKCYWLIVMGVAE